MIIFGKKKRPKTLYPDTSQRGRTRKVPPPPVGEEREIKEDDCWNCGTHLSSATPPDLAEVVAYLRGSSFRCWVLEEWRRVSIPDWRRILNESRQQGDRKREEYARWMLREILLDPEYKETGR